MARLLETCVDASRIQNLPPERLGRLPCVSWDNYGFADEGSGAFDVTIVQARP